MAHYTLVVNGLDQETQNLVRMQASRMATNRQTLDPSDDQIQPNAPGGVQLSRSSWLLASPAGIGYIAFDPKTQYSWDGVPGKISIAREFIE